MDGDRIAFVFDQDPFTQFADGGKPALQFAANGMRADRTGLGAWRYPHLGTVTADGRQHHGREDAVNVGDRPAADEGKRATSPLEQPL